ncbi:hypothetical protein [Flavobacterium sp.]|jgi:hypothetical protein|uniref:hypothetical protein n=1 Tax=Flavobacterium sp. TaxID=239 RepID=UPI0037C13A2B
MKAKEYLEKYFPEATRANEDPVSPQHVKQFENCFIAFWNEAREITKSQMGSDSKWRKIKESNQKWQAFVTLYILAFKAVIEKTHTNTEVVELYYDELKCLFASELERQTGLKIPNITPAVKRSTTVSYLDRSLIPTEIPVSLTSLSN